MIKQVPDQSEFVDKVYAHMGIIYKICNLYAALVFGIDVFKKFREINNYSETLQNLIQKQLRFYRRPYEIWLVLASLSVMFLFLNLSYCIDNVDG